MILSLFLTSFLFFLANPLHAIDLKQKDSINISASIGQNRVTINGYTSPQSRVELTSPRVYAVTYSDDNGYFIFDKTILPRHPSDLCLSSIDNHQRHSYPVCIPPPPENNDHTDIGPILLPPTITLENDQVNPNSTILTSGQSIPNSQISLHFYKVDDQGLTFPKPVQAYSLPSLSVNSDSQGNFNINLPTAYASDYRLYASTRYSRNYSPKSNTLIYILPSLFWIFLQQNRYLVLFLPLYIITLIVFFALLHFYLPPKKRYLPALKNDHLAVKIN
jgi:uncharacterized protein YcfL